VTTPRVDRSLDLRGHVCPTPTVETSLTLRQLASGQVMEVLTDYYPAKQTIPALMAELGYPCELIDPDQPVFRLRITKT
jgi:TusA-related sulfurtransferase